MKSFLFSLVFFLWSQGSFAKDPGMEAIGSLSVKLIFATDDDPTLAGHLAKEIADSEVQQLRSIKELQFRDYALLGTDQPDILKGYESWATPLRPSKEILVSFQPTQRTESDKVQMVLEYWQSKRKIFSTNPLLTKGKTLYLLGPEWRKGRLILAVRIEALKKT